MIPNSPLPRTTHTQLSGRWLILARLVWGVLVAFAFLVFITSIPVYFAHLQTVCVHGSCTPGQLTPQNEHMISNLSLYAAVLVVFNVATSLVWLAVGIVLFLRRSDDWMALLVSLTLMVVGAAPPDASGLGWWPTRVTVFLSVVLLFLVFCLFPNGRFVPRWMCWLPVVYSALNVLDFFADGPTTLPSWLVPFYFLLAFGCIGLLGVAQIYRYRHVASPIERQQSKWVMFSTSTVIVGVFTFWVLTLFFPLFAQFVSLYDLFFNPITIGLIVLIPLSLGMAILRYRLWEIDVIINRTLVYSTLTVILALIYAGLVIMLQSLLRGVINQTSDVAIVTSTLAVSALFQPLRQHIQKMIDHRFYRQKYNAAQALVEFGNHLRLREDIDLTTLTDDLLDVVQETMKPTHVSLWLRPFEQQEARNRKTQRLPHIDESL